MSVYNQEINILTLCQSVITIKIKTESTEERDNKRINYHML
jgi:hypothetical protein